MSILPCSVFIFIFIFYIWIHSCDARMLLHPGFAENKVKVSVDSSVDQGTNVGDVFVVDNASMHKAEEYTLNRIGGHVKKVKVNGRKGTTKMRNGEKIERKHVVKKKQKDDQSVGFESADYSQPRTHPPSHN